MLNKKAIAVVVVSLFLIFEAQGRELAAKKMKQKRIDLPPFSRIAKSQKKKRLNLEISQKGINKISVARDRIAKVIGNDKEYTIDGDSSSGVIFISSNLMAGDMSPITIITEKGYTADLNLRITKSEEPAVIVIKKPILKSSSKEEEKKKEDIKALAIEGIREISSGNSRNYSFRRISIKTLTKAREPEAYSGYRGLLDMGVEVERISEYGNRYIKILKYEYRERDANLDLLEIRKILSRTGFRRSLGVSERGNSIIVVYKQ